MRSKKEKKDARMGAGWSHAIADNEEVGGFNAIGIRLSYFQNAHIFHTTKWHTKGVKIGSANSKKRKLVEQGNGCLKRVLEKKSTQKHSDRGLKAATRGRLNY